MKKLIALLGIMLLCTACPKEFTDNRWIWDIHNDSGQTLKFKYPDLEQDNKYNAVSILNTDVVLIKYMNTGWNTELDFSDYMDDVLNKHGEDVYWQILSDDGSTVLKTWTYSDRNLSDQRFFDESSWTYIEDVKSTQIWRFTILPEDVISE